VKGAHGEGIVLALPDGKLFLKVLERVEFVGGIEIFVVLAVTAFHLSVMSRSIGLNELVADAEIG
jgi:hypothetical protein